MEDVEECSIQILFSDVCSEVAIKNNSDYT